jgi:sulfate/thiosulfate transport system ATP-binding protein
LPAAPLRAADVEVAGAAKRYGDVVAVAGIDLHVASGEFFTLLGPSGSGKTTTLRMIAGFERPDAGTVLLGGRDVTRLAPYERDVNTVFQDYALFPHMTVGENVGYGLKVRKVRRAERDRRVAEVLEMVRLDGYADRRPIQLSGGQRQRVALARALAIEPKVLLLDEPFGALDAQVRKELRRWLRDIHDRTGHTTLFVTHDQEEALELADRLVVMSQGAIEQVGTPGEVYDRPNSPFVFGFIGESSAVPVGVEHGELRVGGRAIGIPAPGAAEGPGRLYFRPHDVELVEGDACLAGVVTSSRRVGGSRRVELEIAGSPQPVEIDLPYDHPAGSKSRIAFRPKRWRLFKE